MYSSVEPIFSCCIFWLDKTFIYSFNFPVALSDFQYFVQNFITSISNLMYSVKHNYFKTFLITKGTTEDIGIIVCKIMVNSIIITSFLNI